MVGRSWGETAIEEAREGRRRAEVVRVEKRIVVVFDADLRSGWSLDYLLLFG